MGYMSTQTNRTSVVGSNTAGQSVPFSFPSDSSLLIFTRRISDGDANLLTNIADYSVSLNSNQSTSPGGTITMIDAIPTTFEIHVVRSTARTQTLDLTAGGTFNPQSIEDVLDKLTRTSADNTNKINRSMHLPDTDPACDMNMPNAIDRASLYAAYDSTGRPIATAGPRGDSNVPVSTFGETLINAADAAAARTLLDVNSSVVDNSIYVNVKSYGAIGDGVTDDTNSILQAIYAVSPICTDFSSQTLDDYTIGEDFNSTNVYRGGGTVILPIPSVSYRITDTIFINSYVTLEGEGSQGIFYEGVSSPQGTVLYFDPPDANNKVAIAMTSFDKNTGERYDLTELNVSQSSDRSRTLNAGIRNLSIYCRTKTLAGLKMQSAVNCFAENISIAGDPIIGLVLTDSVENNFHNLSVNATTQGILLTHDNIVTFTGNLYTHPSGSLVDEVETLPYSNAYDDFNTLQTGLYAHTNYGVVMTAPVFEGWERGTFQDYSDVVMIAPYFENIDNLVFHTSGTMLNIISPTVSCEDANLFYCEYAQPGPIPSGDDFYNRQITLSGDIRERKYNRFMQTGGSSNLSGGFLLDIESNVFKANDDPNGYSFIEQRGKREKSFAKTQLIDQLKYGGIISDPNKIAAMWLFDALTGTSITDIGDNSHTLTTSVDAADLSPSSAGLAPIITPGTGEYADAADSNDFSFGDGSTDSAFSLITLVKFASGADRAIIAKRDATTSAGDIEWFFGTEGNNAIEFSLCDDTYTYSGGTFCKATTTSTFAADNGQIHTYIGTYDGSEDPNNIKIYRDGTLEAADKDIYSYSGMHNTTAQVGTYTTSSDESKRVSFHGYILLAVIKEELTATEVKRLSDLLLGYANAN
jgi:hypothetical protein